MRLIAVKQNPPNVQSFGGLLKSVSFTRCGGLPCGSAPGGGLAGTPPEEMSLSLAVLGPPLNLLSDFKNPAPFIRGGLAYRSGALP